MLSVLTMQSVNRKIVLLAIIALTSGCTQHNIFESTGKQSFTSGKKNTRHEYSVNGQTYKVLPSSEGYLEIGVASWYGKKFHGRLTANGDTYDMYKMTAAHKSLPLPTMVKVTNLDNGRKTVLLVNDRGPFHDNRLIDLSYQAALKLGFANKGTAPVVVEALHANRTGGRVNALAELSKNLSEKVAGKKLEGIGVETPKNVPARDGSDIPTINSISYFLQIGAFSQLKGAQHLMGKIDKLIGRHEILDVNVRILQSETEQRILHKVWIGPIKDEYKRELLVSWVQEMNLGNPIRVDVD